MLLYGTSGPPAKMESWPLGATYAKLQSGEPTVTTQVAAETFGGHDVRYVRLILYVPGFTGAVHTKLDEAPVVGDPPLAVQLYPVAPMTAPGVGAVRILSVCDEPGKTVEPHIPETMGGIGSPGAPIGL